MKTKICLLIFCCFLPLLSVAFDKNTTMQEVTHGLTLLTKGQKKEAFRVFLSLAENGNVRAQYYVATMYKEGEGVSASIQKSFTWFLKAANQDDALSQFYVARSYEKGYGVNKNIDLALYWYERSAKMNPDDGSMDAQFNLGNIYLNGYYNIESNKSIALKWLKKAAKQGDSTSQFMVGLIYSMGGDGVTRNSSKSYLWNSVAEKNNYDKMMTKKVKKMLNNRLSPTQKEMLDQKANVCIKSDYLHCG